MKVKVMKHEKQKVKMSLEEIKRFLPIIGLVAVILLFTVLTKGDILSPTNLLLIWKQAAMQIIACVGMTFVLAHGNLDFSFGANIAISCAAGALAGANIASWLFLPVCILTGIALEVFMCFIHLSCKVPAIVVSWALMFFNQGIMTTLVGKYSLKIPDSFVFLDNIAFYIVVTLAACLAGWYLLDYTRLGKYNKAIGSNIVNAEFTGIPVNKYKYLAYLVSGTAVGICAVVCMARGRTASTLTASGTAIDVLIAVVLGGMSLGGGTRTRISAGIIGTLLLQFLTIGLTMVGVDNNLIGMIKGIIFLSAVFVTFDRKSADVII